MKYIYGIKFGKLGVLVDWGTREEFFPCEHFEQLIERGLSRVGCAVYRNSSYMLETPLKIKGMKTKLQSYVIRQTPYWHFGHIQDAENFMTWLLGGSDGDIYWLNKKEKEKKDENQK